MAANPVVRARIDARIKSEAAAVLNAMGLTLLVKIANEKALPFDPLVPNEESIRGELTAVGSPDRLLTDLSAEC